MPARIRVLDDAVRRARHETLQLGVELANARRTCGLTQTEVARILGWSASKVRRIERGQRRSVTHLELASFASTVGLAYSGKLFIGSFRLRDAAQLEMINGYRTMVSRWGWSCRIEEPIPITGDLRAFDLMLRRAGTRVGHEFLSRFADAQGQVRPLLRKQRDAGLDCLVVVLKDNSQNRRAAADAGGALRDHFPLSTRAVLTALRNGQMPRANGIVFWRPRLAAAA